MSFETVYSEVPLRKLEPLARTQVKVKSCVELKTACKQVLSVSATNYITATERAEQEVRVSGKVITRVIYIDEFDSFNSEERADEYSEKFTLKNHESVVSVSASAVIVETIVADTQAERVDADSVVELALVGVLEKNTRFVTDVRGDADCKKEKMSVAVLSKTIEERFVVDERLDLDKNCEGVLGVDSAVNLRDISMGEGKLTLKGSVSLSVIGVKSGEAMTIYNSSYDFDFNKTINVQDAGIDCSACGSVAICGMVVRAENKTKPELSVEVELLFSGNVLSTVQIDTVTDAICFSHDLLMTNSALENLVMPTQTNTVLDVEGNMTMPENSPYISRICSVGGFQVGAINILPTDNKVSIEGVLHAQIVYECEEKQIHSKTVSVGFTSSAKIDGVDAKYNVVASVQALTCNIKARRGRELMVDARVGLSLSALSMANLSVISELAQGDEKKADDSAITIYIAKSKETIWDITKKIGVPVAEIIAQNPQCESGIKAGERIFIYKQRVVNF